VRADRLSFAAQVRIFSESSHLVAAHGAGLANMVFMPPGAQVLELQPEAQDYAGSVMYRVLASMSGHSYTAMVCPTIEGPKRALTVDCD
jgi:capsular polysaccharide biosynthesis protein